MSAWDMQRALKYLGFDPGKADGIFGPMTRAALMSFQSTYKLDVDGLFGAKSAKTLLGEVQNKNRWMTWLEGSAPANPFVYTTVDKVVTPNLAMMNTVSAADRFKAEHAGDSICQAPEKLNPREVMNDIISLTGNLGLLLAANSAYDTVKIYE